jgi:hypothetical protein
LVFSLRSSPTPLFLHIFLALGLCLAKPLFGPEKRREQPERHTRAVIQIAIKGFALQPVVATFLKKLK